MADVSRHVLTHRGLQIWLFFEPSFTRSTTCQDRNLFLSACFASFATLIGNRCIFLRYSECLESQTLLHAFCSLFWAEIKAVSILAQKDWGDWVTGFEPWSKVPGPCHPCWAGSEWPHAHVTWICLLLRFPGLGPRVFKETVLSPGVTVSVTIAWFFCPVGKSRSLSRDQV